MSEIIVIVTEFALHYIDDEPDLWKFSMLRYFYDLINTFSL